jgi:hypothetical protein
MPSERDKAGHWRDKMVATLPGVYIPKGYILPEVALGCGDCPGTMSRSQAGSGAGMGDTALLCATGGPLDAFPPLFKGLRARRRLKAIWPPVTHRGYNARYAANHDRDKAGQKRGTKRDKAGQSGTKCGTNLPPLVPLSRSAAL